MPGILGKVRSGFAALNPSKAARGNRRINRQLGEWNAQVEKRKAIDGQITKIGREMDDIRNHGKRAGMTEAQIREEIAKRDNKIKELKKIQPLNFRRI